MNARALLAVVIACAPIVAHADNAREVPARARALAHRGRVAYDAADYGAAVAAFEAAYELAPNPALLFDLAQTYRLGGHCEIAAAFYRRYLATNPDRDARAIADDHLAEMARCSAERAATVAPAEVAPPPPPIAVPPPAPVPVPTAGHHRAERGLGVGLFVVGGLAIAASVNESIGAHDAANEVSADYAHGATGAAVKAADARGQHDAMLGRVFGVAGVAGVASGALLYYLGSRAPTGDAITVVPGARSAEVHVQWRF